MAKRDGNSGKHKETFPKIAAEATIKKVTMADKAGLAFADLEFSPEQYAQLERWRKYSDKIRITLEQIQGHFAGEIRETIGTITTYPEATAEREFQTEDGS